jgi:LemA protein
VLTRITEARSAYARASGPEQQAQADAEMRGALGRLFAVAENYPELKADTSFQMLQERISAIEEQIADRREFYNHSVNAFNVRIEQIPDVFMANLMRLEARELFRAAEEERRDVEVSFP